jgi:outer membrane biosynthesis protein TonB
VMGSLTKEQIERVVRQHRNEIKFCYEQELQKNPKLAGSIKIKFTISGTGSVMSALVADTSMKSPAVERCMTGKIQRWAFPEPKGGGIVIVNYPFNFSA